MYTGIALLILISLAPIVILLWYFDHLDKEKESRKFLWVIFLWGVFATAIAGGIEFVLDTFLIDIFYFPLIQLFVVAFIFTAVTEEALKYWVVKRKAYDHPAFNEYFDGIIYAVTASLGFAALENVLYVLDGGLYVGVIRALMAVPAHALFGVMMGYYIGLARFEKNPEKEKKLLGKGLFLAILFHGIYDFLLLSGTLYSIFVIPMLLGMFLNARRKIKHLHVLDKVKGAQMPKPFTKWNYIKTGVGMIFFTIGVLMLLTVLLFITGDPIGEELFQEIEFDVYGSSLFVGIFWLIAYAFIREKKSKKKDKVKYI